MVSVRGGLSRRISTTRGTGTSVRSGESDPHHPDGVDRTSGVRDPTSPLLYAWKYRSTSCGTDTSITSGRWSTTYIWNWTPFPAISPPSGRGRRER